MIEICELLSIKFIFLIKSKRVRDYNDQIL